MSAQVQDQSTAIAVRRVAGNIGALITGVDIAKPLDPPVVTEIRRALLVHKVIFFRGQDLDHETQIAFARQFGDLTHAHPHDDAPPEDAPEIFTIDPRRYEQRYGANYQEQFGKRQYSYFSGWHTDVTAAVNPPAASILRAQTVPEFGGDTTWTNLVAAYEGLSNPLQRLADGLAAQHRFLAGYKPAADDSQLARRVNANLLVSNHPVVRVHPETGERALFVNPGFTDHILGVSTVESRRILDLFYEQIARPDYTVRFRWEPGSVAFWDNRATAHLAPTDLGHLNVERVLHRVTLVGDRPVGPTGFVSQIVEGRPFLADARVKVG
jgi:alpha-ketoglutarate-dependent sulfate ester dioxygenase